MRRAHGAALASEARGELTANTSQATTQIAATDGRGTGGLTAHAAADNASLATTGSQASAHVQTAAAKVGQHLAHAGSHTAAGLQSKTPLAGQQIQESAALARAGADRGRGEPGGFSDRPYIQPTQYRVLRWAASWYCSDPCMRPSPRRDLMPTPARSTCVLREGQRD
jgi:hypothetical protein